MNVAGNQHGFILGGFGFGVKNLLLHHGHKEIRHLNLNAKRGLNAKARIII
jgi:hypothetical protein